jgi:starch phosphorylase
MRSAYDLRQAVVGVGLLWKYGYYDQNRNTDGTLVPQFREKNYNFLDDTGIKVRLHVFGQEVAVKAYLLHPETFGTAPIFLLSTDLPENSPEIRAITHKLYDDNKLIRLSQYMVLGIGGAKVLEAAGFDPEVYHLNEAHPLPVAFHLLSKNGYNLEDLKHKLVFTTHTPEDAGNERTDFDLINRSGLLCGASETLVHQLCAGASNFNHTLVALRLSHVSNAVSKLHGEVARDMWKGYPDICPITHVTNAQNRPYWQDEELAAAVAQKDFTALAARKRALKVRLFEEVADQTGKILDPDVLTIVWARRFAGYKRANLLLKDMARLIQLSERENRPIQVIWAGKPYPIDHESIRVFNEIHHATLPHRRLTILTGYELSLSKLVKQGSDVWLNTPRYSREASGTSGMTASMNASINCSIADGWMAEYGTHGENAFIIPHIDHNMPIEMQDANDLQQLYRIIENDIVNTYYGQPQKWWQMASKAMTEVTKLFNADRMADEYYTKIYAHGQD